MSQSRSRFYSVSCFTATVTKPGCLYCHLCWMAQLEGNWEWTTISFYLSFTGFVCFLSGEHAFAIRFFPISKQEESKYSVFPKGRSKHYIPTLKLAKLMPYLSDYLMCVGLSTMILRHFSGAKIVCLCRKQCYFHRKPNEKIIKTEETNKPQKRF